MTIVHFSTELTGGAGAFARSVHEGMLGQNIDSLMFTRELSETSNTIPMRPRSYYNRKIESASIRFLNKTGLLNDKYAMFGLRDNPIASAEIIDSLGIHAPTLFIYYWISGFIGAKEIAELKEEFPSVPVLFICLDEAFLTGGCHYTWDCQQYTSGCGDCPAFRISRSKRKVAEEFNDRIHHYRAIDPLIVYPSSCLQAMGQKSLLSRKLPSLLLPLGAVWEDELNKVASCRNDRKKNKIKNHYTILIRSSSEYRKGCDLLYTAVRTLFSQNHILLKNLHILTIGDDYLSDRGLGKLVKTTNLGLVNRSRLLDAYIQTDLLMVTSLEDSGPLMVNEAVALGIYVVSTPVGVAADLVRHDMNGYILDKISPDSISNFLITLLSGQIKTNCTNVTESYTPSALTFEAYCRELLKQAKYL